MKSVINYVVLLILPAFIFCCARKGELTPEQYSKELPKQKEELTVRKDFDNISFGARYRPIEELVVMDKSKEDSANGIKAVYDKYADMHYFTFSIESRNEKEIMAHNNNGEDDYYMNLDYLVNSIQYDFYLVDGKDTLPCAICHYERNYGISPVNNLNLSFERKKVNGSPVEDLTLVYEDKLFDVGTLRFKIEKETLTNLPELKYEKN